MARAIVVGGGVAGLAFALFAARRRHEVVLVERDPTAPGGDADAVFRDWVRPGVPHARHSHKFLGLSCAILSEQAPDVLADLRAAGALEVPISRFGRSPDHPDEFALAARRLVYEAVLRRAVDRQPGVRMIAGVTAQETVSRRRESIPVVTGVRAGAELLTGDLVVDATGRRGRLARSVPGIRLPEAHVQRCGFVYMTRHYRLLPGRQLPVLDRPLALNLGYGATLAFPADNGTFSLSVTLSTNDPLRRALLRVPTWDRFVAAVPHTSRWSQRGEPIGQIEVVSGIEDRWQRLVDGAGEPVVGGMVLLGDAALQNNPTYGRGVSLAIAQARQCAMALDTPDDPVAFVAAFDRWSVDGLGVWHRAQTFADAAALEIMNAEVRGEPPPERSDPFRRLMAGVEALAATDPVVARALARMAHLLITPAALLADREVVGRVVKYLQSHEPIQETGDGLSRAGFETIAAA